jgi:hypothetical protein
VLLVLPLLPPFLARSCLRFRLALVIGVDVHKHSLTAVAVDALRRTLAERNGPVEEQVVDWARSL